MGNTDSLASTLFALIPVSGFEVAVSSARSFSAVHFPSGLRAQLARFLTRLRLQRVSVSSHRQTLLAVGGGIASRWRVLLRFVVAIANYNLGGKSYNMKNSSD